MQARKYAQALHDAATAPGAKPDAAARGFIELLRARGQHKLLRSVLSEYRKIVEAEARRGRAVVRVAHEKDARSHHDEIERVLRQMGIEEKPEHVIDESVVGGVRIESHGAIYDRTYRKMLIGLYRDIVRE